MLLAFNSCSNPKGGGEGEKKHSRRYEEEGEGERKKKRKKTVQFVSSTLWFETTVFEDHVQRSSDLVLFGSS